MKMELTSTFLDILKSLASVKSSIALSEGKVLENQALTKDVVARATLKDVDVPAEFGIYDTYEFIKCVSLIDDPVMNFQENKAIISSKSGGSKLTYWATDPSLIPPVNKVKMPDTEVNLTLSRDEIDRIKKAAGTLGYEEFVIHSEDGKLSVRVLDADSQSGNSTGNVFEMDVKGTTPDDVMFDFYMSINKLKMLYPGDYKVSISSKKISKFEYQGQLFDLEYFIALEKHSDWRIN